MKKTIYIMFIVFMIVYMSILIDLNTGAKEIGGIQASCLWEDETEMYYQPSDYLTSSKTGLPVYNGDVVYSDVFGNDIFDTTQSYNLVQNGDFSNSLHIFRGYQNTYNTVDDMFNVTSTNLGTAYTIYSSSPNSITEAYSHKYYFSFDMKTSSDIGQLTVKLYQGTTLGWTSAQYKYNLTINEWNNNSFIFNNLGSHPYLYFDLTMNGSLTSASIIYFDNALVFDLNDIYGITTPTQTQFEKDLDNYLENVGKKVPCTYEFQTDDPNDIDGYDLGDAKIQEVFETLTDPFSVIGSAIKEGASQVGTWIAEIFT